MISEHAIIDPSAIVAADAEIGPWTLIGPNVEIGSGCVIGPHVVIERNTKLGKNNRISSFASVGGDPQDLAYSGEDTFLEMGDNNVVRENVTINRGSAKDESITRIGSNNCFLAYSHVAHDCVIGNHVLFVNNASVAGHVIVEDYVALGAFTAVHQFCRVGAYSYMVSATEINKDIPPFMVVKGFPGVPVGANVLGLKRHKFSNETIRALKRAYLVIYRRGLKTEDTYNELADIAKETPEVQKIIDFMRASKRGSARQGQVKTLREVGSEDGEAAIN
jgi:UDP-N-acetylglucosamine acyltransferase